MAKSRIISTIAAGSALTIGLQVLSVLLPITQASVEGSGLLKLVSAAVAQQNRPISYNPPKLRRAIRTAGTGSRGCERLSQVTILPLVPDNHVGLTVSPRPTFMAFLAGAKSAEFTLVEPGVNKPLVVQTVQPNSKGIIKVNLPATTPDLVAGKDYRWSVAVICNPKRRSQDIYAQGWIQRVPMSNELGKAIASTRSEQARARLYAEAGMWYDAISTLSNATSADPKNSAIREDLASLLNQVGLPNIAIALESELQTANFQMAQ
ncbi:protein of unknown function DUF928 [Leptolyngbyaceae cyanobacterium JSC-12]|nr:protein of unknown function DUF928 [Leptolyngbyaceae cyanobacterium JSC-12]